MLEEDKQASIRLLAEQLGLEDPEVFLMKSLRSYGGSRNHGRTTRQLLDALYSVGQGQHVFIGAYSPDLGKSLAGQLRAWAIRVGSDPKLVHVVRPGGEGERTRGFAPGSFRVIIDHYCPRTSKTWSTKYV